MPTGVSSDRSQPFVLFFTVSQCHRSIYDLRWPWTDLGNPQSWTAPRRWNEHGKNGSVLRFFETCTSSNQWLNSIGVMIWRRLLSAMLAAVCLNMTKPVNELCRVRDDTHGRAFPRQSTYLLRNASINWTKSRDGLWQLDWRSTRVDRRKRALCSCSAFNSPFQPLQTGAHHDEDSNHGSLRALPIHRWFGIHPSWSAVLWPSAHPLVSILFPGLSMFAIISAGETGLPWFFRDNRLVCRMLNSNYRPAFNPGVTDHPLHGKTVSIILLLAYEIYLSTDCQGKVCLYNGTLNLETCECQCSSYASGSQCEQCNQCMASP